MSGFMYNDMEFSLVPNGPAWDIVVQRSGGKTALVAAGLFAGLTGDDVLNRARALVRTIYPVGIRIVGPDVAHPNRIGDLKIVGPDVTHPNFIYWDKDSTSCPRQF